MTKHAWCLDTDDALHVFHVRSTTIENNLFPKIPVSYFMHMDLLYVIQ
jgi:hypothetical protein